jgi:FG-GAP-like repeat
MAIFGVSGQMVLTSISEGVLTNGVVAAFADSDPNDAASNFAATIDWGDGTTEVGTVSGNGGLGGTGLFTVAVPGSTHFYADEGSAQPIVTVTRNGINSQSTFTGPVTVTEGDSGALVPFTINASPNQAVLAPVATFFDSNTNNTPADFTATIDWGDGTTSAGIIAEPIAGDFVISGVHTYAALGQYSAVVKLSDDAPGTFNATATATANVGIVGKIQLAAPGFLSEGAASFGQVATFTDGNLADTAGDLTATIDWGDGTPATAGTVSGSDGSFTVSGLHIYVDEGSFQATVTLTNSGAGIQGTATGTISVADLDHFTQATFALFGVDPNQLFSGEVATFTDTTLAEPASDLSATISWGDGASSSGTVSGGHGLFTVSGTHTYATAGLDTYTVTLSDDAPSTVSGTATGTAIVGISGQLLLLTPPEGTQFTTGVAVFTDNNFSVDTAGGVSTAGFTATIDWGDGATTAGTITLGLGALTVSGSHTYADEGSFPAIVTLTRTADQVQGTASGTIAVSDTDVLTPVPQAPITTSVNQAVSGTIETFIDSNPLQIASDFTATINWGDGTTSTGSISELAGTFTISGSHTYATVGVYTVVASVDDAPGAPIALDPRTVTVTGISGHTTLASATEDMAVSPSTTVSTFADSNGADVAAGFSAKINWGDGTTTVGTVSGGGGTFNVAGGHTYAVEGNFQASVTLTRTSDSATATASGQIAVAEGPTVPEDFGGTGMSGVLWRQTNSQSFAQPFLQWSMNGSSVTASQSDTFQGTPVLPDASWKVAGAGDFSGDSKSDVLWQRADGSLTEWLMNGASIVSNGPVTNQGQIVMPGLSWSVAGTGDFDGDARDDILWRNADGSLQEWLMNGTTITSSKAPTFQGSTISPDASWSVAAMGDFDGDGHQDILWRNTSGALSEWLMNGSSITSSQAPTFQGNVVTPDSTWIVVAVGDFSGDNSSDIVWRQSTTGLLNEWQMNGTQIVSSQIVKFGSSPVTPDASWSLVEIGDFNGDSKSDALWRQTSTGALSEWQMDGAQIIASNTVTSSVTNAALDSSWQVQSKPTNFA